MTILVVVSVFDSAVGAYGRPIFVPSTGVAMRSFSDEVNRADADNGMFYHPDDFGLFHVADYNDSSGRFSSVGEGDPILLVRAKDVKVDAKK